MNIRTKLTLRFIGITAVIMVMASALIYVFSSDYRKDDFYNRLSNKANNTAKLLIEVDEVDAELLRKIEEDNPVGLPGEKIIVYNYQDKIVFTTDEEQELRIPEELIDQIRLDEEVRFVQNNFEVLGFLFKSKYDRFVVIAAATDIYGFKKLKNLVFILLIVFAISIVTASVTGWMFAGRALQPIAKVVNRVDEISISSLDLRVDEGNGQDEIAKLAQTFNSMLSRLETSFVAQKNFIANASHELRTPLTSVTGQLEVTLLNKRTPEEYEAVISSVLEDIRNLNNLSNRLLLLAQSSASEREKKMTALRIDELIWQVKEDILRHNPTYIVNIDLHENLDDDEKLIIKGDEQLMKAALLNIIENGCKYSANKTTNVFVDYNSENLSVLFRDSGIGIPAEEISNVFEPFYRGSNTKSTKGHGIGLSLVKGIMKLHNGAIQLKSSQGEGTMVTMILRSMTA